MSFSVQVKKELCAIAPETVSCAETQLAAILQYGRALEKDRCLLQTENRMVIDFLIDYLEDFCAPILTLFTLPNPRRQGTSTYCLMAEDERDLVNIRKRYLQPDSIAKKDLLQNQSQCAAFLRGAFLICGSMNDPNREYHLEFVVAKKEQTRELAALLSAYDIPVKYIQRKGHHVLYVKESEAIEDLLTLMGATKASLSIMEIKVVKDLRNKINRVTNCETANLEKTADAAARQLEDIRLLQQQEKLASLPDPLKEAAAARLQNPEMSLMELVGHLHHTVSRSGLNHRFERIHQLAQEYRKESL